MPVALLLETLLSNETSLKHTHPSFFSLFVFTYEFTTDSFYDFTQSSSSEVETTKKMSYSFGYSWLRGQMKKDSKVTTTTETKTRYITASMRIERYYASVREEVTALSDDATTLLNNQDYIGFFKACGPNYIRGVRRAQEVTAYFIFTSTSEERSSDVSSSIQVSSWWWRRRTYGGSSSQSTKNKKETESMRIVIKGFGIGLSQDGSETFVAQTLQDYQKVMDFAFHTMVRIPDGLHIGMVYGMEIVPWVENTAFQVAANILDESIEIPLPRSMIPRAYLKTDPTNKNFNNTSPASRALYRCKEVSHEMDKYGYCCEEGALYDPVAREYDADLNVMEGICRPLRSLAPTFIKDNMVANGEFVSRMDRAVRYKMNQLSTLERCISAVRAIPERYDYWVLTPMDTVKQVDGRVTIDFSVFELKMALDPFNDYSTLKHMAKELDEFLEMFVQPCYAAIFGATQVSNPEASYFMSYPWYAHDACTKLSCFGSGMRWDRNSEEGGCVPGLIAGASAPDFDGENCKKDIISGKLECKNSATELKEFRAKTVKIWENVVPAGRIDYFMDNFCLPKVQNKVLPPQAIDALKESYERATSPTVLVEKSLNVALNKETDQISTFPHFRSTASSGLAVDGNTDGEFQRNSVTSTRKETNPWWWVDLGREHTIQKIVFFSRKGYERRSEFFIAEILLEEQVVWTSQPQQGLRSEYTINVPDANNAGVLGDKVRISLPGKVEYLHIAEVQVWNKFY